MLPHGSRGSVRPRIQLGAFLAGIQRRRRQGAGPGENVVRSDAEDGWVGQCSIGVNDSIVNKSNIVTIVHRKWIGSDDAAERVQNLNRVVAGDKQVARPLRRGHQPCAVNMSADVNVAAAIHISIVGKELDLGRRDLSGVVVGKVQVTLVEKRAGGAHDGHRRCLVGARPDVGDRDRVVRV